MVAIPLTGIRVTHSQIVSHPRAPEAAVRTLAEVCSAAIAFVYRSIDRLILNIYIPTLQTPGAMAIFLRQVCKKPILSGLVFKWLTDRFVAQVRAFAQAQRMLIT